MHTFVFYISGHGFGHATRQIAVMEAIREQAPDSRFLIRTWAEERVFHYYANGPFEYEQVSIDVGVTEKGILDVDIEETLIRWRKFLNVESRILEREVEFINQNEVSAIVFDLPPLAAEIAYRSNIPSIGIGNFTWDYIYNDYITQHPEFESIVKHIKAQYEKTGVLLQLPMSHEMDGFSRRESIPLISRRSKGDRDRLREDLGILPVQIAILVALRGEEVGGLMDSADGNRAVLLSFSDTARPGVLALGTKWQRRFSDVLHASDVVLSKPGYGVVSECIANRKPLLHLPRFNFSESEILVRALGKSIPHEQIDLDELRNGELVRKAEQLLKQPTGQDTQQIEINGASVAADRILEIAGR